MKTNQRLFQRLFLLAGGLLVCLPAGFAAPGGGVGFGTASAGGGGHSVGSAPVAAAHSTSMGGFRSSSGLRSGLGSSAGIAGYHGRIASGGNRAMPNVASNTSFSGDGLAQAGASRASMPVARVNNAWTDPVESRSTTATADQRGGMADNARVGNNLYPGAYGYTPSRAGGNSQRGQNDANGSRGGHRYYFNNFPYGVYYPYLYNNYGYGGYGNYGDLGYGSAADYADLNTDGSGAELGAPNFVAPANNYYSYVGPDQANPNATQAAPTQPLPDAPAVGPQAPASAERPPAASQGPDSLVEAVQSELAKRGYFDGKPDAMYSDATKEAIRRFQTDQHLPATGRINEATLHALRLD